MQQCYQYILLCSFFIVRVSSLKCYQCSSLHHIGCLSVNRSHLMECPRKGNENVVCRSILQIQYFTGPRNIVLIRECAHHHNKILGCEKKNIDYIHYTVVCECNTSACNNAKAFQYSVLHTLVSISFYVTTFVIK